MRVLLVLLLIAIAGCGEGSSPPGGGEGLPPEASQEKVDKSPAQAASEQKAAAKKSVEGQETLTLKGHSDPVWSVSFSPDGKRIVSGPGQDAKGLGHLVAGRVQIAVICPAPPPNAE